MKRFGSIFITQLIGLCCVTVYSTASGRAFERRITRRSIIDEVAAADKEDLTISQRADRALQRFHMSSSPELERRCFTNQCKFDDAHELIGDLKETSVYWSLLNCVKHSVRCQDEAEWFPWLEWQPCSATCGAGEQVRWRGCRPPKYWGSQCNGKFNEVRKCNRTIEMECFPEHLVKPGTWGQWGAWSACDLTCGQAGRVTRFRDCLPSHTAAYCVGSEKQRRGCTDIPPCSVNGAWSDVWEPWSRCMVSTCGGGMRIRLRDCTRPSPDGLGKKCLGPSSEYSTCQGPRCRDNKHGVIAHLLEHSVLLFRPQESSPFLSIFLRFKPVSSIGTILSFTGVPQDAVGSTPPPANVKIKTKMRSEAELSAGQEFVRVSLVESGHVMVAASLNGSDTIFMQAGKVRVGSWNTFRATIVSDVINVRVNDDVNMAAVFRASPQMTPDPVPVPSNATNASLWENVKSYVDSTKTVLGYKPDSLLKTTRAILLRPKGSIGLGKVRKQDVGFRGYVSELRVNFQEFNLKKRSLTQHSQMHDPMGSKGVEYLETNEEQRHDEAYLPYFDGHQRIQIPLTLVWWSRPGEVYSPGDVISASDVDRRDLATLEMIFKPHAGDGIILFNRGERNLASHMKLIIENGTTLRFIVTNGGTVKSLYSDPSITLRRWNKLTLQFLRDGTVRLQVNDGELKEEKFRIITEENKPGPILLLGGAEKNLFEGTEHAHDGATERHADGFHGYVFSLKQNQVEQLDDHVVTINLKGMLASKFFTSPVTWKSWYFKPTYKGEGVFNFDRDVLGNKSTLKSDEYRELFCLVPISPDVTETPNITWYKDGAQLKGHPLFRHRIEFTSTYVRSRLFLIPTAEGSRELSGVYSCVISEGLSHWLLINHVVSVLNSKILNPGGVYNFITYIRDSAGVSESSAVLIIVGSIAALLFVLITFCSFCSWCVRKIRRKKRKPKKNVAFKKSVTKNEDDSDDEGESLLKDKTDPEETKHRHHKKKHKKKKRSKKHSDKKKSSHKKKSSDKPEVSAGRRWSDSDDVDSSDSLLDSLSDSGLEPDEADLYEEKLFSYNNLFY